MAGATKTPAALADIIVTRAFCYILGYEDRRKGVRGLSSVASLLSSFGNHFSQHGLSPQDWLSS